MYILIILIEIVDWSDKQIETPMLDMNVRHELNMHRNVVLSEINASKEILFGAISETVTKDLKIKKWKRVAEVASMSGLLPENKCWRYVRDTMWPNWRKRALEKQGKVRLSHASSEYRAELSDVDEVVLHILGAETSTTPEFQDYIGNVAGNEYISINGAEVERVFPNLKRKLNASVKTEETWIIENECEDGREEQYEFEDEDEASISTIIKRTKQDESDHDAMFWKSLIPPMKQLGTIENLEFRGEVINLLKTKLMASYINNQRC